MGNYFKEVRKEVGKVIWPDKKTAVMLSAGVLVLAGVVAGAFALIDMGVLEGLKTILGGTL